MPHSGGQRQRTVLVLFDFDLTLCDEDTYSVVIQMALLAGHILPSHLQTPPEYEGWPEYMRAVLEFFHEKNITADMIKERLQECPMTKGMQELLRYLHDHRKPSKLTVEEGDENGVTPKTKTVYETVILSDANSCFIQWILEKHHLSDAFAKVLTNPSEVTADGRIKLGEYHEQTECNGFLYKPKLCRTLFEYLSGVGTNGSWKKHDAPDCNVVSRTLPAMENWSVRH